MEAGRVREIMANFMSFVYQNIDICTTGITKLDYVVRVRNSKLPSCNAYFFMQPSWSGFDFICRGNSLHFEGSLSEFGAVKLGTMRDALAASILGECYSEGSFSKIFLHENLCVRFTPLLGNGRAFLRRIEHAYMTVITKRLSHCRTYSFGTIRWRDTGILLGEVVVMESLAPLTEDIEETRVFAELEVIARCGFHNDFTLSNIMQRVDGVVCVIDFDLLDETKVIVAASAYSFIEVDFAGLILVQKDLEHLRQLFAYSQLSLCLSGEHHLYQPVLDRLVHIFQSLTENAIHIKISQYCEAKGVLHQVPIEVLVKLPDLNATTVNVFDLRGNAYAHNLPDWERYPSLVRSNGVYWPTPQLG